MSRMKPLGRGELSRFLQNLSKDQLIEHILDLSASFTQVQDYYQAKVHPADEPSIRQKYKAVIEREFFPSRGDGKARLSVAREAVMDYKKVAASIEGVADLMLYYVETGVRFTNAYGDINEKFYISMERMYEQALDLIGTHGLHKAFERRSDRVVEDTRNIGWGFHDTLAGVYVEHFGPGRA